MEPLPLDFFTLYAGKKKLLLQEMLDNNHKRMILKLQGGHELG